MSVDAMVRAARARRPIPQIFSIQYLRGLAALAVVVFHACESSQTRFVVGAAGVDIFFVISGFIMWTLTERAESDAGSFLWRRLVRVAPPYWLATLLILAIWMVRPNLMWMPPVTAPDLAQSLLFIPHLDPWGRAYPVVIQGWTLHFEMFFYLVFAAVLLLPRNRQILALTLGLGGLVIAGLVPGSQGPVIDTYTSPLLLEFLAGVGLGRLWTARALDSRLLGGLLLVAGFAAFVAEAVVGVQENAWRPLIWGLPAVAVVAGALCLEGAGAVPRWRVPEALGDASYSIYLFHVPIIAVIQRLLGGAPLPLRVAVTLVACSVAGILLFNVFEKPLTTAIRRLAPKRRPKPAGAPLAAA